MSGMQKQKIYSRTGRLQGSLQSTLNLGCETQQVILTLESHNLLKFNIKPSLSGGLQRPKHEPLDLHVGQDHLRKDQGGRRGVQAGVTQGPLQQGQFREIHAQEPVIFPGKPDAPCRGGEGRSGAGPDGSLASLSPPSSAYPPRAAGTPPPAKARSSAEPEIRAALREATSGRSTSKNRPPLPASSPAAFRQK